MTTELEPVIGDWYTNEEEASFEVVAFDEEEGLIEIQFFDGTVEEIDLESWYEMELSPREPPEDWSGPFDDLIPDDLDEAEVAAAPHMRGGALEELD